MWEGMIAEKDQRNLFQMRVSTAVAGRLRISLIHETVLTKAKFTSQCLKFRITSFLQCSSGEMMLFETFQTYKTAVLFRS